jgi:putative ABC transport system ATP-binding protein
MVAVLAFESVSRIHGSGATAVVALQDLSLEVAAGELVLVMGPSGSGKSTLLTLAGGLDRPTQGRVRVEGQDLGGLSQRALAARRRRAVGYVFQDLNLIDSLTAVENVALPLELDGARPRTARVAATLALSRLGLADLAKRFPEQLSGGQQQRVAIARACIGTRRLLLADEPTGALDSENGHSVLQLVRLICDGGAAAVVATHERTLARYADRVVELQDGKHLLEQEAETRSSLCPDR